MVPQAIVRDWEREMTRHAGWGLICAVTVGCAPAVSPPSTTVAATAPSSTATPSTEAVSADGPAAQPDPTGTLVAEAEAPPSAIAKPAAKSPLDALPTEVRESLDLFADATLQLQRVKLLQERGLQKRLGVTAAQQEVFAAANQDVEQLQKTLQQLKPAERDAKLRTEFRPKAREYQSLVDEQLNPTQERELFREVVRKQRGAITFLLPGVAEELGLSDQQRYELYQLVEATRQAVDFDNLSSPFELAKLIRRANEARKQAEGLLTPEQSAKFAALIAD